MFKPILISSAIFVCFFFTAKAQTDTSSYNLGRIDVKKQFTQSITIKGSDLERMQFSNLAEAINVWLYGTYSNGSTLVYVVDGNIITDVNAYSIFDVDEITLVQNAIAQVSGAGPAQQLVFIKLKTNRPGKQGIEAAGQSSLVNMANHPHSAGAKSTSNLYHQYYLSGYKNFNSVQMGISADYQHDVMPVLKSNYYNSVDPFHFDRFKFNGYLNATLWKGTSINFGINYVPHTDTYAADYNYANTSALENNVIKGGAAEHMAGSNISVDSKIIPGLTNTLSGAYSHYNYFEADSINLLVVSSGNPTENVKSFQGSYNKISNFLLKDNLIYHKKAGSFDFEPALNFSYRKYDNKAVDSASYLQTYGQGGIPTYNLSKQSEQYTVKLYLLTPSLNISYKDVFNLQGGFVSLLNSAKDFNPGYKLSRLFPFLSTSVDVFKLAGLKDISLMVFGSFSRQNSLLDDPYATLGQSASSVSLNQGNNLSYIGFGNLPIYPTANFDPLKELNNYQAGLILGLSKNISFSYNFQQSYSPGLLPEYIPFGINGYELVYIYYYAKEVTNRIGLNYTLRASDFSWRTGLNIAQEKFQISDPNVNAAAYASYLNTGHRYSGGFTNRLTCKNLFAGLDLLYQLGQRPVTLVGFVPGAGVTSPHVNSVSLQSLYFGSQVKINKVKYAEAFASFRNIAQNNSGDITDNRRFYGLGVKVGW
ncbi:hypothetical protein [Mucilaginibacter gotjawali]|uniref:Uncharacterized protein n=2 Tax=Mucilaginibacter gotjawali TaxID=1550579 RepID=A0A0X8X6H4_9SPHI|nr:hypothetical protein [Mucilaginibacter gotjawali]MBB3054143.1 hypothetical protein [Mucilaginibacter gotjawali]BAU54414.1 hypothetical protein MgSA37_02590 [Mucilaginibacter gotjawali]